MNQGDGGCCTIEYRIEYAVLLQDSKDKRAGLPDKVVSARQVSMLVAQLDGETAARQQAETALAADRQALLDEQQRLETWAQQLEEREKALAGIPGNDVP